jgi:hypothetical protein
MFFAKGFENAHHSDCILRRSGHNRGVADKSEVDSPGFLCCHQIGLIGSAAQIPGGLIENSQVSAVDVTVGGKTARAQHMRNSFAFSIVI